MKIALLICGQARILNDSFIRYLKKENINFDTYIHYWLPENNSYMNCGNLYNKHNINNINIKQLENNIKNIYQPKNLKSEIQKYFNHINMNELETNTITQTISQYYSIQKSFEIIENPEEYTHFIKIRFDFQFNFSNFDLNNLDNQSLYFTGYGDNKYNNLIDIIWIVPNKYKEIFKIYDFIYNTNNELQSTPESILLLFIHINKYDRKVYDANCTIDRSYIKVN
jgi:hypothetical protein